MGEHELWIGLSPGAFFDFLAEHEGIDYEKRLLYGM